MATNDETDENGRVWEVISIIPHYDETPRKLRIQYLDRDGLPRTAGHLEWNGKYWDLSGDKVGITKTILDAGITYGDQVYKPSDRDLYKALIASRYSGVSFSVVA